MDLQEFISRSDVIVKEGRYVYLKMSRKTPMEIGEHFMVARDEDEMTIVTKVELMPPMNREAVVGYYKLIEFKTAVLFQGVGFIAKIADTIAKQGLNILVVSTFSKYYILLKEETYEKGLSALKSVGFKVLG